MGGLEFQWILEGSRLRQHGQAVVKPPSVGPDPRHSQQDHHPPVSMILYKDSRILNTGYRISYRIHQCRIQDTRMHRIQDAGEDADARMVHTLRSLVAPLREAGGYIYIYIYIYIYGERERYV